MRQQGTCLRLCMPARNLPMRLHGPSDGAYSAAAVCHACVIHA